jgi:hypothetical protein
MSLSEVFVTDFCNAVAAFRCRRASIQDKLKPVGLNDGKIIRGRPEDAVDINGCLPIVFPQIGRSWTSQRFLSIGRLSGFYAIA